jgi:transposase
LIDSPAKRAQREVNRGKELVLNANLPALEAGPYAGRKRLTEWLTLKAQEPTLTTKEIAGRLGVAPATLYTLISRATKEGWLKFDDPIDRLEHEIIPKAIDNLSEFMDQKDKQATLETMKHTVFKQFQESKGISEQPTTVLALKIETVDPANMKVITGHVVGRPRVLNGEVSEA